VEQRRRQEKCTKQNTQSKEERDRGYERKGGTKTPKIQKDITI
jgi:hypothetical protein